MILAKEEAFGIATSVIVDLIENNEIAKILKMATTDVLRKSTIARNRDPNGIQIE